MMTTKQHLLGSVALLSIGSAAQAADLPVSKAAPIEYVRICTAYGAGFFYIPGTDTCLRLSGRARFEYTAQAPNTRQSGTNAGDYSGYRTRLRINVDARTQTSFGTLRAFLRLETGSQTGYGGGRSGTQERIGNAFPALGADQFSRAQQFVSTDKAFIQLAGFTAGRASSFFDFYAHDFEFVGASAGSDVAATNLLAYTASLGNGFSATLSAEDPTSRRSPLFSPTVNPANVAVNVGLANFGLTVSPAPIFTGYAGTTPTRYNFVDVIERNRMPDFVAALRADGAWGSGQLSAAVHELNVGNISTAASTGTAGVLIPPRHTDSAYGFGVQGGVKLNLPFIATGDTLYLQGAYGRGAQSYAGYSNFSGTYAQSIATIQGQRFVQTFSDAALNPFTGQLQLSETFSIVGAYLHYWTPEWRSAVFASYGEQHFGRALRTAQGAAYSAIAGLSGNAAFGAANAVGTPGSIFYSLSQALRDNSQVLAGGTLIWSPVKDLDIGFEGFYTRISLLNGRVINVDKDPTAYSAARITSINAGGPVRTATYDDVFQGRIRIQRDF